MSSTEQEPLFSIVIPVYNRVAPLQRALKSIQAQDYQRFEVVVVDDGSSAEMGMAIARLVAELKDNRIKLMAYQENRNGAYARNQGIAAATGNYICFLDSDDEWLPAKLSECKEFIRKHPDCKLFYHRYANVRQGKPEPALPVEPIKIGQTAAEYSFCTNRYGGIQSSCITVEAEHAKSTRFNEQLKGHQDWDFVLRATASLSYIGFIPAALTWRHIAEGNVGMVSRDLNYQFSREFLIAYRRFFSLKATAAYAAYILTHKRLKTWPKPDFDQYQLLAWLYHPYYCYQQYRQLRQLKKRCHRLVKYCKRQSIRYLALSGFNSYSEFFLGHHANQFEQIILIDKSKTVNTLHGKVRPAKYLSDEEWQRIQLVALMTDNHSESMRNDLKLFILECKIINF
ncbi:glycosyltransferase family 2 protein [Rheinheimera aquimaris]|jgi:glycosyltransferase involved in cell wall biosynthesis|uniref:glycosyltransferase family 2 protein n=1 Tax=Rheinheimera aquimaris TaxID=412437 RepID=UPI00106688A4|nr:glycosyltransferase family 2 protein [Rheinheimera aquimaris]|tara:strand:- start:8677 stop:9870 length:1194 start_codon:yes stop_codon:yes gene_type:complete